MLKPGRYDVVVGNPPYITVKDKKLNALYRELYASCVGKYALSVPFAEKFFQLAKIGRPERSRLWHGWSDYCELFHETRVRNKTH